MGTVTYPGTGADSAMRRLNEKVGEITGDWAGVEDGLFTIFVIALTGTWFVDNVQPFRAVFFTFSSYEGKMRMLNNAMKARFASNVNIWDDWRSLKREADAFNSLRNDIAHLAPAAEGSPDPVAKANVRLIQPFWKSAGDDWDFNRSGYSICELQQEFSKYRNLSYRLSQFSLGLIPPRQPQDDQSDR